MPETENNLGREDLVHDTAIQPRSALKEWRRGWHLVLLAALALTCAPVTLPVYTLGIFVDPLHAEFGWNRGQIQTAVLFSTGPAVICAPLAGALIRRFGLRWTIIPGIIGMAVACVAAASINGSLWQFYAAYALMALLGAGAGIVGWTTLIAGRFDRARGLALGLGLSGTGLCAILMPQIAGYGIAHFGWRGAYLLMGAFTILIVLPACLALLPSQAVDLGVVGSDKPDLPGMEADAAIRNWRFWLLGISTALIYLVVGGLAPNIVPALRSVGISGQTAVSIMGAYGMAIIFGRIFVGSLVDHIWAPIVIAMLLLPAAAACYFLQDGAGVWLAVIAVCFIGMATGMELDVLGFLTSRYFGLADYSRIYGRLYIFAALAASTAPMAYGYASEWTNSYALSLRISAGLLVAGAIAVLLLGRYPVNFDSEWPTQKS